MKTIPIPYLSNINFIFNEIATAPYSIWFNSGKSNIYQQGFDIITGFPYKTITSNPDYSHLEHIEYDNNFNIINKSENLIYHHNNITPFSLLKDIIKKIAVDKNYNVPFWHGAAGYFGYDLNQIIFDKLSKQKYNPNIPLMAIGIYAWSLIYDHDKKLAYLAYNSKYISQQKVDYLVSLFSKKSPKNIISHETANLHDFFKNRPFVPDINYHEYSKNFNTIKNHIKQGNCYQINYAIPFKIKLDSDYLKHSSWQVYQYLTQYNNTPFGCYFKISDNLSVLSFSPERFLKVNKNIVTTMPIKGTRPKVSDPKLNAELIEDLTQNPKDRAENIMITDLLRNDLNKYCIPGTVITPKICELQTFPTVHHLVSTITGVLKTDTDSINLFEGCFPGGSITGTPKLRAMQIIQELENTKQELTRYIYCGSIGYINCNYNLDTNIAIRTIVCSDQEYKYWAGSGIVADSDCEQEYIEIQNKLIKTY